MVKAKYIGIHSEISRYNQKLRKYVLCDVVRHYVIRVLSNFLMILGIKKNKKIY